ncbi:GNAT family N-acetyltransferase [Kitasatospora brasiliensis]|uniref:GNAT family N-acetyltransferase n=1 Tax=Kitasatospora brasiliensis TaxID=3058040 RepID=UPI0029311D52|nr:GNAT family N-acetyltransferase [Kitasatospora sp. K002]
MISSGQTVIRRGGVQDAGFIAELHAHSWRTTYTGIVPEEGLGDGMVAQRRELWSLRLAADYGEPENTPELLVAERAGEAVGFIYLVPQPDGGVLIDNLHVRPGLTSGGIGHELLAAARAHVAERHPGAALSLEVLRDNTRAIAFYEREGAERVRAQVGEFPGGFLLPEYVYAWPAGRVAVGSDRSDPADRS